MSVLEKAREIVANGWYQGDLANEEGTAFCALGALGMATDGECQAYRESDRRKLVAHLPDFGSEYARGSVSYFNDHTDTTQEMVLQLFDKAIADESQ